MTTKEEKIQSIYYEIPDPDTGELRLLPRVTHLLDAVQKPGLDRWRGRVGNQEADRLAKEGAAIGTEFHSLAADINRGAHHQRGWQPPGHLRAMAFAYIDWMHAKIGHIHEVEKQVHSEEHFYAGTLDLVATLRGDDDPAIIDIKTSNSVDMTWPLQLAAYKLALREHGILTVRRIIIRIPKKGECIPEMYEYTDHEDDEAAFLHVRRYWEWAAKDKDRQKRAKQVK